MGNKELIEQAKLALVSEPKLTKENTKAVEATDATMMNELLAFRASIDDEIKTLTNQKKAVDDIIKDAIGKNDELLVHGAKVASISRWRQTDVVAEVVKEMFAVKDYPELYKRSDRSKLNIH